MKFFLGIITTLLIIIGYKEFQLNHCKSQFEKAKENTLKLQKETTERQQEIKNEYQAKLRNLEIKYKKMPPLTCKQFLEKYDKILIEIVNEVNK